MRIWFAAFFILMAIQVTAVQAGAALACADLFRVVAPLEVQVSFSPYKTVEENLANFLSLYGIAWNPKFRRPRPIPYELSHPKDPVINGYGFGSSSMELAINGAEDSSPLIVAGPVFSSVVADDPGLRGEIWTQGARTFRYFDPGWSVISGGGASMDEVLSRIYETVRAKQSVRVQVPFDSVWAKVFSVIESRQVRASVRAVRHYEERKPYLSGEARHELRFQDLMNRNNNDLHLLMRDTGKSPLVMSADEFENEIAVMLKVARYQAPAEFMDMLFKGFHSDLPHTVRVPSRYLEFIQAFLELLAQNGVRVAELTRFNRLHPVSVEMMDAFVYRVLSSTHTRREPVDLFILECDEATMRLYSGRYRFQILVKISNEGEPAEYLMYLDTRTETYRELLQSLQDKGRSIQQMADPNVPPIESWTGGWEKPKELWEHSGFQKREWAISKFASKRESRSLSNLPYFIDAYEAIVKALAVNIESRARVLLVGELASHIAPLLREQYPQRQIDIAKVSGANRGLEIEAGVYDDIVFLNSLSEWTPGRRRGLLRAAFRGLKHDAKLTIVDRFREQYPSIGRKPFEESFAAMKEKTRAEFAHVSSEQLNQAMDAFLPLLLPSLRHAKILDEMKIAADLQATGFVTNRRSENDTSLGSFKAVHFTRR